MAQRLTDSDERAAVRRVLVFDAGLALACLPLLAWLGTFDRSASLVAVVAIGALFLLAEWFPIDVEIGDQSHAFSFTAVPLVVGLCTLPPELVVSTRVVASALVLAVVHRQDVVKLATNAVSHMAQTAVAAAVIVPLVGSGARRPMEWLVVVAAIAVAELVGTAVVTAAISLYEGAFDRELLDGALSGWTALVPDVLLALVAVVVLDTSPAALWLVAGVGLVLAAVIRGYSQVTSRYRVLEVLDGFTTALGEAVSAGTMREVLEGQLRELLHAESAWLDRPGARSGVPMGLSPDRTTIAGTVLVGADEVVIGVGSRRGEVREFDGEDVRLFNLLLGHVGVGLQNVRLVEALKDEAHANELLATLDPLTGMANRTLFHRWVADGIADGHAVSVLVLGLDRFREVNETLGHAAGDRLLAQVGERIRGAHPLAARLGGDEFGVLWLGSSAEVVQARADDVLAAIGGLYRVEDLDLDLDVAASGGLVHRAPADDAVTVLRQADVAMHLAKAGGDEVVTYRAELDTFTLARLALVGALRAAIDGGEELELHYQPQIDLRTQRVVGAEALLRWTPKDRPPVRPDEFIEVAERTGLITPLTRIVLREAVAQAARWAVGGRRWRVAANLSARNLLEDDLVAYVAELLATYELPPELFEIELTETSVMSNPERAVAVMGELRALGVSISVDDFGTGHSSLAHVAKLPVDQLKIDRSFVLDLETEAAALAVVQTIVDLGHRLGLEIVAEGVETDANVRALAAMGCTTGQGYYYARPMPAAAMEAWAAARAADPAAPLPV